MLLNSHQRTRQGHGEVHMLQTLSFHDGQGVPVVFYWLRKEYWRLIGLQWTFTIPDARQRLEGKNPGRTFHKASGPSVPQQTSWLSLPPSCKSHFLPWKNCSRGSHLSKLSLLNPHFTETYLKMKAQLALGKEWGWNLWSLVKLKVCIFGWIMAPCLPEQWIEALKGTLPSRSILKQVPIYSMRFTPRKMMVGSYPSSLPPFLKSY